MTTAAAAAMALIVGIGGWAAYAFFTGSGSGTGTSSAGALTMSASVTAGSGLYPGGSGSITVVVRNTSSGVSMKLASLTQNGTSTIQSAGKGTCDPSVVTFTAGTLPTGVIAAGSSVNVSGTVAMTGAAADGCQGATFSIPLRATGQSS